MGPSFAAKGTLVFQILALGALLNFLARLPYGAVQALGRPDITAKIHLWEVPLYIALCFVLIPRWGLAGAAVACTCRLSVDTSLMFWAARKYCLLQKTQFGSVGRILTIVAIFVLLLLGADHVIHGSWVRLLSGAVLLLVCYVAIWQYAIRSEDKPVLVRTLRFARYGVAQ